MKNKYGLLKVLLVLLLFVIAGVIYSCVSKGMSSQAEISGSQEAETERILPPEAETVSDTETGSDKLLCVHVCGAVKEPGVYYLPEDSRVHEAVEMAGGFADDADESMVNLADLITDGGQIYIPSAEEVQNGSFRSDTDRSEKTDSRVNINTAGVSELMTLTGIGESKAEAIIAYRENVSQFEKNEDIINVSGIGESVYEKIRDSIKVK